MSRENLGRRTRSNSFTFRMVCTRVRWQPRQCPERRSVEAGQATRGASMYAHNEDNKQMSGCHPLKQKQYWKKWPKGQKEKMSKNLKNTRGMCIPSRTKG